MSHMKPDIEGPKTWYEIDGNAGITAVPIDLVGPLDVDELNAEVEKTGKVPDVLKDYYEGNRCFGVEVREKAWGARMAAPGYLDCTEWTVFDTEDKAREHLKEMYEVGVCPQCGRPNCGCGNP